METDISVFVVEDDEIDREAFERFVKKEGLPYRYTLAGSLAEAKAILEKEHHFHIAILDYNLGDETSRELIPHLKGFPYIIVTGVGSEEVAVQSMKEGASDYIVKDPGQKHLRILPTIIKNVLHRWELEKHADFLSVISHELRAPLAVQKGVLENLLDGIVGPLSEPQQKMLQMAKDSHDRLEFMIGNMLAFTTLNAEGAKIELGVIQTLPFLAAVLKEFERSAQKRGVTLVGKFPESLPPIFSEEGLVRQVLLQLVDNALRFAKKEIHIAAEPCDRDGKKYLRMSVTDDGPGISPAGQRRVFEPFAQIDRPAGGGEYLGIGLGLTLCNRIMEKLDGALHVESKPGNGSTFYFLIPQHYVHRHH